MNPNGQRTEDTSREKRREEGSQGFHLQQSPSATGRSNDGTKGLLVHIENFNQTQSILLQEAKTIEDVRQGIFREIPSLSSNKLIVQVFVEPKGTANRLPIQGTFLQFSELYATVYLFKH